MTEGAMERRQSAGQGQGQGQGQRPRPRRITSYPLVILAALAVAVALIKIFEATLEPPWDALLIDRERGTYPLTVQNVMWVVFMLGLGELFVRLREAMAERRQLRAGYLPEDETTVLQAPDLRQIYARAREVTQSGSSGARRFLPRLIQRVAIQFQTEIDLRYSMTRYIIWLIPSLGFIGTVIGISLALAYAGQVDLQDPTLLAELTKRLAVAFNTTLLALVMSAVLVLIQHIVQAREEGVLNEVGQYCLDNLINRLYAG
jgi:biopolymer transport protein ExbB/TolQ